MVTGVSQLRLLSEYNQLMNQRQYAAAAILPEEELFNDKGAYFKSIFGTLNHLIVADIIWLKRFTVHPSSKVSLLYIEKFEQPKSLDTFLFKNLAALTEERTKIDRLMVKWIRQLTNADIKECISYTNMAGKNFNKPYASLIYHLFLHQVHHRGQVTTLLSQCGVDFGETDLVEIIEDCNS